MMIMDKLDITDWFYITDWFCDGYTRMINEYIAGYNVVPEDTGFEALSPFPPLTKIDIDKLTINTNPFINPQFNGCVGIPAKVQVPTKFGGMIMPEFYNVWGTPELLTGDKDYSWCEVRITPYPTVLEITVPLDKALVTLKTQKKSDPDYVKPSEQLQYAKTTRMNSALGDIVHVDSKKRGFVIESFHFRETPEFKEHIDPSSNFGMVIGKFATGRQSHVTAKNQAGETITYWLSWRIDGLQVQA